MPRWPATHPGFVEAIRVLDADGMPYAELWRRLQPVAARIGEPRPSYWRVRRIAIAERRAKRRRMEAIDRQISNALRGLGPLA